MKIVFDSSADLRGLTKSSSSCAPLKIITAEKENVLLVPNKALRFYTLDEKGDVVRYKDKGIWLLQNGKPKRINIATGVSNDDMTEIVSDVINVGNEVILENKNVDAQKANMRMRMPR